jgi:hypothetical protein
MKGKAGELVEKLLDIIKGGRVCRDVLTSGFGIMVC